MDQERPIEKLLRDYARKRGHEFSGPRAMHPAARRLLKEAVARRFRRTDSEAHGWGAIYTGFWTRLAWSLATLRRPLTGAGEPLIGRYSHLGKTRLPLLNLFSLTYVDKQCIGPSDDHAEPE